MLHRVKSTRMTRIVTIATTLQNRSEREFGTDSSLEGDGFEPSVPQREGTGLFRDHLDRPPAPSPSREAAYLDSGTFTTFEPGIFARYGTGLQTRIWKKPWRSSGPNWLS